MNAYLQEALVREKAKDSFETYRQYISEDYEEWSYVSVVNDHLQKVYDGDIRRLMVFMGPQHGKTKAVSEDFASFWVGNRPKTSVIGTAYNYDRAMDYGRDVRARVKSPEFKAVFPEVIMNPDSTAADRWSLTDGGGYYAAGVGTALTGRRGDLMIIDDPFSGPEGANSDMQRERVWKWYNTVFRTRLSPRGAIVLVMTRWHDDDLAGRLLDSQKDRWAVLEIKTEAEEDDILGRCDRICPHMIGQHCTSRILYRQRVCISRKAGFLDMMWFPPMPHTMSPQTSPMRERKPAIMLLSWRGP